MEMMFGFNAVLEGLKLTSGEDAVQTPPVAKACVPATCIAKLHKDVSSKITGYAGNVISDSTT